MSEQGPSRKDNSREGIKKSYTIFQLESFLTKRGIKITHDLKKRMVRVADLSGKFDRGFINEIITNPVLARSFEKEIERQEQEML